MHAVPPRCTCRPPPALLHSLRLRAAWLAAKGKATGVPAPRDGRYGHSATLVAAAAAPGGRPGRAATTQQSSRAVEANRLLGFRVMDLSSVPPKELGIVDDVLEIAETGQTQPLLHVRIPGDPRQPADALCEEHLIPYVPEIVPTVDLRSGLVFVQPPTGLLDLGRQQLLLATLRQELAPYTTPPPLSLLARMGLRVMPNSRQLAEAGRHDLVAAIKRAGGFLEVAQALGLRSQRKPAGYWEDEMNLDEELTLFVAAHWTKFPDPESGQSYWYNQITHRISWEEPILPERVEIDDEGGFILTEAEEDRVMPSRAAVMAAGRYDLHHAILRFGGYTAASEILGRPSAWPPHRHLRSLAALRHELRSFLAETGLPRNRLPTASQLIDAGRGDLYKAIVRRGGFNATAQALGWETQRRGRQTWADVAEVARELRRFIFATHQGQQGEAQQRRGRGQSPGRQPAAAAAAEDNQAPLPADARMPTHRELASAGRHDLKYAVQQHGSANLAALLGIPLSPRGAHRRSVCEGGGSAQPAAADPG